MNISPKDCKLTKEEREIVDKIFLRLADAEVRPLVLLALAVESISFASHIGCGSKKALVDIVKKSLQISRDDRDYRKQK